MKVAVLMGSDSDLPRLEACLEALRTLEIPFEARVLSAHRTPKETAAYVEAAAERGIGVFICAAGGAAHLAGVVAAHTALPVIGIPMDNPPLGGLDALLATVQMPGGIPVATVATGGGGPLNAALFAAQILALSDAQLAARLAAQRESMSAQVHEKDARLQQRLAGS
jgi:5-(carboxyamino)imidazole ribonucleotide mutase